MKKILVLGGSGLVGSRFMALSQKKYSVISPSQNELDILNTQVLEDFINSQNPEVIINFVAFTDVDGSEEQKDDEKGLVFRLNVKAPEDLAEISLKENIHLIQISTDYVFDGKKEDSAYLETDLPNPINWYGKTKLLGENKVLDSGCLANIIRIEMAYSSKYLEKIDFARYFFDRLINNQDIMAVEDQRITPTFVDHLVGALDEFINKKNPGIFHVASKDSISPYDFAVEMASQLGVSSHLVKAVKFDEFNAKRKIKRPKNGWLDCQKFENTFGKNILKTNREAITEFLEKAQ